MKRLTLILCFFLLSVFFAADAIASSNEQIIEIVAPILSAYDDMEEYQSDGSLFYYSTHLELGCESPNSSTDQKAQVVFLRFDELQIPPGAEILSAYIQFSSHENEPSRDAFDWTIAAEDTAHSDPLPDETDDSSAYAISSRTLTGSIRWQSDETNQSIWNIPNQSGENQQSPDLTALLQHVVDKSDWRYENAIAFILEGSGGRSAVSYEQDPSKAAMLHVTYSTVILEQEAPDSISTTGATNTYDNDGSIVGTTIEMEYMPVGGQEWIPCDDGAVTGLSAGEYLVRYAAKPAYEASPTIIVSVYQYILDVTLQPGSDETEMNFTWYCRYFSDRPSLVQIALASDMTDDTFPVDASITFCGENCYSSAYLSNSVTVCGLQADTEYVYRLSNGISYSEVYSFKTGNPDSYSFILVGDPQIGGSGGHVRDANRWIETLDTALTSFPDASFILSVGDQIENAGNEEQYASFFSPEQLTSYPLVPTIGNHDSWGTHARHFSPPNESETYATSAAGGNYWFTYGDTLFMVLNSNSSSTSSHALFIAETIAQAGDDFQWKIVVMHHSIYSSASHSSEEDIRNLRNRLYPVFDEYDIDVVLMGHDHCYTRSYQMLGGIAVSGEEAEVIDPEGTLYITANSASGSKYYDLRSWDTGYSAARWQGRETSYSCITITEHSFSIATYKTADNTLLDSYTIIKTDALQSASNN